MREIKKAGLPNEKVIGLICFGYVNSSWSVAKEQGSYIESI
jgi:hypothetical protein